MAKKKQKTSLDATLQKAKELGMSYAEYQVAETLNSIDFRKKYKEFKKKKAKKNGRTKLAKNGAESC